MGKQIKIFVFIFAGILAVFIYFIIAFSFPPSSIRTIRLEQVYAFLATIFLYLALLASPLYRVFPNLKIKSYHQLARPALGVSAFFFALLHAFIAFFGLLKGFSGLGFLSPAYLISLAVGFCALFILAIMAVTSLDFLSTRMGRVWVWLHRFVYLAGLLIVLHALMLGSHFKDLSYFIPTLFFLLLLILLILESLRIDKFMSAKYPRLRQGRVFILLMIILFGMFILLYVSSFGIHAKHLQQLQ